ncbi:MAG: hypothetical protein HQ553_01440 [Chloroflexi bacterium]|nr:hypothetical protein [Chloroflexota bacterium]
MKSVTFSEVLDAVESLPEKQREDLVHIVQQRLSEERRESLARSITQAREEYARGEIRQGTISDLMGEIS